MACIIRNPVHDTDMHAKCIAQSRDLNSAAVMCRRQGPTPNNMHHFSTCELPFKCESINSSYAAPSLAPSLVSSISRHTQWVALCTIPGFWYPTSLRPPPHQAKLWWQAIFNCLHVSCQLVFSNKYMNLLHLDCALHAGTVHGWKGPWMHKSCTPASVYKRPNTANNCSCCAPKD